MVYQPPVDNCIDCDTQLEPRGKTRIHGRRCRRCYNDNIYRKRVELKRKCVESKGDKCADCGGVFHQCVYDFHHVNEDRNNDHNRTIGHMTHKCRPWKVIQEELDNCVMLCSNCHRLRHFEESVDNKFGE